MKARGAFLIPLQGILRRKSSKKIQTNCSDENGGETFCLVCSDGYSKSVAGKVWVQLPNAKCGHMTNVQVPLPEDIIVPAASRMYQMMISEVLRAHISVLSFVFQRDL
jgi:hypothetical protein